MRIKLEYFVLRCHDLEQSRAFYEAIGLRPVSEQHGKGAQHYACDLGGIVLELYPSSGRASFGVRVGLCVASVSATLEAVRRAGGEIRRVHLDSPRASAVVLDPDGHEIHLTEEPRAPRDE